MAKGLVQKATRKQALSYTRYAPNRRRRVAARRAQFLRNPLGVTSIAAINGRRARANTSTTVVIEDKTGRKRTVRGTKAVAYLKKHHPHHAKKSDFGRLRVSFDTKSGEHITIGPKSKPARRSSSLAKRVARLSRQERALAKKVSSRRRPRRATPRRARYERALVLLQGRRKSKPRKKLSQKAKLSRAARTMEKAAQRKRSSRSSKKRAHKAAPRRSTKASKKAKAHRRAVAKLPMRAYYASERGSRIYGSPVIGIREEDVVVVPARRNGRKRKALRVGKVVIRFGQRGAVSVLTADSSLRARRLSLKGAKAKAWAKSHLASSEQKRFNRALKLSETYSKARSTEEAYKLGTSLIERKRSRAASKRKAASSSRSRASKKAAVTRSFKAQLRKYGYPKTEPSFSTPVHKMTGKRRAAAMKKIRAYEAACEKAERRWARAEDAKHHHGDDMRSNKRRAGKKGKSTRRVSRKRSNPLGLLTAKIGRKTYKTYLVKGKKGKVVHVPRYRLLGFKSEKALQKVLQGSDEKAAEKISKRLTAIYKRRQRAAAKVQKHGDAFTPNARVSYEEWKKNAMKPNKRRGRKGKGRRSKSGSSGWTKAKRRAAARKAAATRKRKHAKRVSAAKKGHKTRARKHTKRSRAARKGAAKRGGSRRKKRGGKKTARRASTRRVSSKRTRRTSAKRGRSVSSKRSRAGKLAWKRKSAAEKRAVISRLRSHAGRRKKHHGGKSKRSYRKNGSHALALRNHGGMGFHANRRGRSFTRNGKFSMNGMMASVKDALGTGAVATVGFVAHRGIGWLLAEKGLAKIGVFADVSATQTTAGSMAPYRRIIAGLIVAAAGIPAIEKIAPKQANTVAAGMVVSLLHQVIVTAMGQFAPTYVPALAGYGDRSGRAFRSYPGGIGRPMGEYFLTGQNGYGRSPMGEYFLTGMNGFGAAPGRRPAISQAAAGMGQYSQAAAGFGQVYQAAAGTPMLSQAAAGVGEYFLTGAQGYGDYDMVQPSGQSGAQTVVDEGIMGGDTHAAERALNISEGVAGISDNGIGVQSIVDPTDVAVPVSDEPMGSRAGILQGQEGIFG